MEMFFGFLVGTLLIAVGVCIYFIKKMGDTIDMIKSDYTYLSNSFDRLRDRYYDLDITVRKLQKDEEDDGK